MPCCSCRNEQSLDDGQDSLSGIEEIEEDDIENDIPDIGNGKARWKKTSKVINMTRPKTKAKSKDRKTLKSLAKLKLLFGGLEKDPNKQDADDEDRIKFKTIAQGSVWNYKIAKMNSDESQESRDRSMLKNITFKKLVKVNRMLGRLQATNNKVEQSQGLNQDDLYKKINFKRLAKLNMLLGAHKKNSTTRDQLDQLCKAFDEDENLNISDLLISTDEEEEEIIKIDPKEPLKNTLTVVASIKAKPSFNVPNNHLTLKRPKLKDTGIRNGMASIANQSPVHVQAELKRIESVSMAPEPNVVRQISSEIKTFMNRSTSKGEKRTKIDILREEIDRLRVEIGKLNEIKEVTGADLREINPIVKAAQKKTALPLKAINQIKGVRINPPKAVQLVMAAICIFKGYDPEIYFEGVRGEIMVIDYWTASQKLLSGMLIDELKDLRKPGVVTPEAIVEFQETIVPELDFDRKKIERAYPYCAVLYDWILRIEQFGMLIAHIKFTEKEKIVADAEVQILAAKAKVQRIKARIEKIELKKKKVEENDDRKDFRIKFGSNRKDKRRTSVAPKTPRTP